MKILVVGGGTSGLMSALILKNYLDVEIDVLYSSKIGTIGVGEGATEHFYAFMTLCGITNYEIINECSATYKSALVFDGWTEDPYMHNVGPLLAKERVGGYSHAYGKLIGEGSRHLTPSFFWKNKINAWFKETDQPPFFQYHFDTFKLIDFLMKKSKEAGIGLIEDEIDEVVVNSKNEIDHVVSKSKSYNYDFYIDSSGFSRVLISKLGAKWISHSDYLKVNSAIVFQTPDTEDYNLWSYARAMDYGWLFRTPVQGRHGNGYIYCDKYINAEQAKNEVEEFFGFSINIGKELHFDAGHVDRAWIGNCVAIGLSSSFIEPLEASSIGTTIQQSFLLMHRLINYNSDVIDFYNWSFNSIVQNIRDFIFLHYMVKKDNSQFWLDLQKISPPESLQKKLNLWKNKLPIKEDFAADSNYILFQDSNFISVMAGMKMFDEKAIYNEFQSLSPDLRADAENLIKERDHFESSTGLVGHKEMLGIVKDRGY